MFLKLFFMTIILLASATAGSADHNHLHKKPFTMQMKTQHDTMAVINSEWNTAQKAMNSGDSDAAKKALQTILDKSKYMEKFEGYKNADKRAEFISEYHVFFNHIKNLKNIIGMQDSDAIVSARKDVQDSCIRCHAMFK